MFGYEVPMMVATVDYVTVLWVVLLTAVHCEFDCATYVQLQIHVHMC